MSDLLGDVMFCGPIENIWKILKECIQNDYMFRNMEAMIEVTKHEKGYHGYISNSYFYHTS